MKRRIFVLVIMSLILAACNRPGADNTEPERATSPVSLPLPNARVVEPSLAQKPAFDFERQLNECIIAMCKPLAMEKMKVADYEPDLLASAGISRDDTLASARDKLNLFYPGMVSMSIKPTTNARLKVLQVQLSPGTLENLPEYDVFIRTTGMSNSAKVQDWGARIRCAPVTETTPWQTMSCE